MKLLTDQAVTDLQTLLGAVELLTPTLDRVADMLMRSWESGGKLLVAGNGGSAAEAMHLAEELVVRYQRKRRAMPAMALCDPTILTCAGNDLGYEEVFARQIEAFGKPGDVFIAMSTSGNSVNLVRAIEQAREQGVHVVGWLGRDGGEMREMCDLALVVPGHVTARIQEVHQLLIHILCDWVELAVSD